MRVTASTADVTKTGPAAFQTFVMDCASLSHAGPKKIKDSSGFSII